MRGGGSGGGSRDDVRTGVREFARVACSDSSWCRSGGRLEIAPPSPSALW